MSASRISDWTALEIGRLYELRSGDDRQRARYLGGLTDEGGQFEIEGSSVPETFARAEWEVYPA